MVYCYIIPKIFNIFAAINGTELNLHCIKIMICRYSCLWCGKIFNLSGLQIKISLPLLSYPSDQLKITKCVGIRYSHFAHQLNRGIIIRIIHDRYNRMCVIRSGIIY